MFLSFSGWGLTHLTVIASSSTILFVSMPPPAPALSPGPCAGKKSPFTRPGETDNLIDDTGGEGFHPVTQFNSTGLKKSNQLLTSPVIVWHPVDLSIHNTSALGTQTQKSSQVKLVVASERDVVSGSNVGQRLSRVVVAGINDFEIGRS